MVNLAVYVFNYFQFRKAAYGVWEGPSMMTEEKRRDENVESREEVETRMAEGMYGGALPDGWGVTEAEMAAVIFFF